ncbi:uncharacterized protein LOC135691427 isoform X2 [Rhopilema esculentum]|uniref:uncharacterized protein LOC135691427 isoform X2 n=1 Tax=Rhopilema esculentum TaxID=499914 RepID=UPI0031CE3F99
MKPNIRHVNGRTWLEAFKNRESVLSKADVGYFETVTVTKRSALEQDLKIVVQGKMRLTVVLIILSSSLQLYQEVIAVAVKANPYGINIPYPYGAKDPLESPPISRDLSMGDTMLTPGQLESWRKGLDMSGITKGSERRIYYWPKAVIPYHIDCSLKNMPRALAVIDAAILEWQAATCIRFIQRTTEKDYLVFLRDNSCWASQGRVDGPSLISVGHGCEYRNVISHLIGHVVGLWHPQNRIDRNDYVRIFWQNIDAVERSSFRTVDDTDGSSGPYDYSSIMHYPWDAFTNSGRRTMLALQLVKGMPYKKISSLDALQVSVLYNCQPPKFAKAKIKKARNIPASRDHLKGCVDRNSRCPEWAAAGYCGRDRFVDENCKTSCNMGCGEKVDDNCKDQYQSCPIWARMGYCSRKRLAVGCKRSCGGCKRKKEKISNSPPPAKKRKECTDKYMFCKRWSALGYCKKHKRLSVICKASCTEECKKIKTTPRPTTLPPYAKKLDSLSVLTLRASFPTDTGRGWEFGKGILCFNRNSYCNSLPLKKCETDKWMQENCAKTCKLKECDDVIYKPAEKCAYPLGVSYGGIKGRLPDSAFSASSHFNYNMWKAAPENGRLYLTDDPKSKKIGAWCAAGSGKGSWLQVDLGKNRTIGYIATQGRDKYYEKVREYKIAVSFDGKNFQDYKEDGKVRVFDGNCDHFTPVMNRFRSPILTRFVRIYPTKFNFACLRMELYGC